MSTKTDIIGKKIIDIYYSNAKSGSIFNVFIDLEDNIRFRLNGYGVSYSDVITDSDDLYSINPEGGYEEAYKNVKIIEFVNTDDDDWAYIILDNGFKLGVVNDFMNKGLNIGRYTWKPNEEFFNAKKIAPKLLTDKLKYEEIVNYFRIYDFGTNMPVLTHLSLLYPSDRVEILKKIIKNGTYNVFILDKLSMAYAKAGNSFLAKNTLLDGKNNGVLDDINFESMNAKIEHFTKTQNLEIQVQLNYIDERINTSNFEEQLFLNTVKEFIKKNYLQHHV